MLSLTWFSTFASLAVKAAQAEDAAAGEAGDEVEVVVTGTRTPEALTRSTLPTGVVSRREAERRGATSVAEALEGQPGLQVNANAYDYLGSPSGIMMQGLDAERVLILRDNERVIGDAGGVVDLDQFGIDGVERVEYVLGPSSSLYGTGALGGVVNVITAAPSAEGYSARGRVQLRSLPELLSSTTSSYRSGDYWAAASIGLRKSDGVRLFGDQPDLALAPRRRWEASARLGSDHPGITSVAEGQVMFNTADGLQTQEFPGLGLYTVDLPDSTRRVLLRMRQDYATSQSSQLRVQTSAQLFSGESKKDRRGSPLDEVRDREQRLLSIEATSTTDDGPRTWVAGLRLEREDFEQNLSKTELRSGQLFTLTEPEVEPVTLSSAAAYAQLAWRFGDQLTLLPGLRGELHRRFGAVVVPRVAAAFALPRDWRARVSVGRGFRAPNAKEYGFLFDHSFVGYRVIGNPDLDPERSWGVSGDLTLPLTPEIRARVSGFRNWVTSLIGATFVGQAALGVDDFSYVNVGSASTMGGDAEIRFRIVRRLHSQVAYTYLFTQNEETGKPLPSRPAHTLLSAASYEPRDGLELTLRNRLVSAAYVDDGISTPGFIKLDLRAAQRFGESLQAELGALNLLDARDDPSRPGDQRPVVGRLYYIGFSGDFE